MKLKAALSAKLDDDLLLENALKNSEDDDNNNSSIGIEDSIEKIVHDAIFEALNAVMRNKHFND